MRPKMCPELRAIRRKRKRVMYYLRYKRRHPSHKMLYGHRFVHNRAYADGFDVCKICGRDKKS